MNKLGISVKKRFCCFIFSQLFYQYCISGKFYVSMQKEYICLRCCHQDTGRQTSSRSGTSELGTHSFCSRWRETGPSRCHRPCLCNDLWTVPSEWHPKSFSVPPLALKEPGGQAHSQVSASSFSVVGLLAILIWNSITVHTLERIVNSLRRIFKMHTWSSNFMLRMAQVSYNLKDTMTCLLQLLYCNINLT